MLETLEPAPPDAILGLTEAFKKDPNPNKINLGVGVYKDAEGNTPVLSVVKAAEERVLASEETKSYLPIPGSAAYGRCVRELIFGEDSPLVESGRAVTAHTPGGTGALRVGADFVRRFVAEPRIWVSTPTWANHKGIFTAAGFQIAEYPYYDPETKSLDFDRMHDALGQVPEGEFVLLHVCCHNPTGVDPSNEQWKEVAALAKEKKWVPFLDFAYQGFGTGLAEDRRAVQEFVQTCPELLIASSFSKNFGLYQDRTGALTLVAEMPEAAEAANTHIKKTVRVNYSNPPAHGGHIVHTILGDTDLRTGWEAELSGMRDRIKSMRSALVGGLEKRGVAQDFSFITRQNGMFSFSGLTAGQVDSLREKKSIYIVSGGRINVAGITPANVDYLCDAIAEALGQ